MQFYAARQPILDKHKQLFAYEVLFREGLENVFPDVDDDQATSRIISGLQLDLGLDSLTDDKPAFINFSEDNLLNGYPNFLPKDKVVVEILETARPTKRLLACCQKLKEQGYVLALDDFEHQPVWRHFYPLIDLIKVDLRASDSNEVAKIKSAIKDFPHIELLAEKVETYDEFKQALADGFAYFQGYFFSAPEVKQSTALNPSQAQLAQLLGETAKEEVDVEKVSAIFQRDVNLSFKLLRYANSAVFRRSKEISNIKQAIVVLGNQELKKFIALLFTATVNQDKPEELIKLSIARARFCELVAVKDKHCDESSTAFLVGMMSLIDAILDQDIVDLMEKLPLSQEIKDALINGEGCLAGYLTLIGHLEKAEWDKASALLKCVEFDETTIPNLYQQALAFADELIN